MPHITVEYADDVKVAGRIDDLLDAIVNLISDSPIIDILNLKLRALAYQQYRVGGTRSPFIHTVIAMRPGADVLSRKKLASDMFQLVSSRFEDVPQVTVELRELEPATYQKRN